MIFPEEQEPVVRTIEDLRAMLTRIEIGPPLAQMNWTFECESLTEHAGWLVRATFDRPDANTGEIGRGTSRKEYVPPSASLSGVVRTCWLLVELTTRHEAMEAFLFDGARAFDPHRPIDSLVPPKPQEWTDDHLRRCGSIRDRQTKTGRSLLMVLVEASNLIVCPGCRTVRKDRYGKWPRDSMANEPIGFTLPKRGWTGEIEDEARAAGLGALLHFV
jgi:hypothetical protein